MNVTSDSIIHHDIVNKRANHKGNEKSWVEVENGVSYRTYCLVDTASISSSCIIASFMEEDDNVAAINQCTKGNNNYNDNSARIKK